jgi:Zn-dependent protease with chaperone function
MVLLPLLYLALVGAVAYGLYWHATGNIPLVIDPAAQYLALLGYGLPVIVGVILLLFLIKPFCARHKGIYAPVVLDPLRQPTLFYLVEQITGRVGAPMPSEIRVDASVNAPASLRRGVFSNELVLTIGMPLFLGMSVQRLSGILAHEFGHFAQRSGMRLRLIIERINQWFYRRAYEPDSWDRFVQRMLDSRSIFVRIVGATSRAGIWVSRRFLIVIARIASVFCRFMSRQMEYDADRYEVHMTGSKQFRGTAVRLRVLGTAFQLANSQAQQIWRDNQLPNDLPRLTTRIAKAFSHDEKDRIAAGITRRRVDVMDTHPPDGDRIRAAEAMNQPGVLSHKGTASRLLNRCNELCRKVTFTWFRDQGYSFTADNLVSLDIVHSELARQDDQIEALHRYVGGGFIDHRVLPIPGVHNLLNKPGAQLRAALRAWREPLQAAAVASLGERYKDSFERLVSLAAAEALSRLHLDFDHVRYGANSADTASIQEQARDVLDDYESVQGRLGVQDSALARRFAVSLALGCRGGLLDAADIEQAIDALRALGQVCEHTVDIVGLERRLRSLILLTEDNPDNPQIANAITDSLADYQRWLDRVNNALIRVPNPLRPGTHLAWTTTPRPPRRRCAASSTRCVSSTYASPVVWRSTPSASKAPSASEAAPVSGGRGAPEHRIRPQEGL